jgi:hypothetical protein
VTSTDAQSKACTRSSQSSCYHHTPRRTRKAATLAEWFSFDHDRYMFQEIRCNAFTAAQATDIAYRATNIAYRATQSRSAASTLPCKRFPSETCESKRLHFWPNDDDRQSENENFSHCQSLQHTGCCELAYPLRREVLQCHTRH